MGIIVRLKVNRHAGLTAQSWKASAVGIIDEYGNPFRIIRLRWNQSKLHKMGDYGKTRGFQDAVLSKNPTTGDIKISYRDSGSIMWERMNGVGAFYGEVAETPKNLCLLSSHHGDRLWSIVDQDIKEVVEKMYEKRLAGQSKEMRDWDLKRIKRLHTNALDFDAKDTSAPELPDSLEKMGVQEQNRLNIIKKQELAQKELRLNEKEKNINAKIHDSIGDGVAPVAYQKEYLDKQKVFSLRKICKELSIKWEDTEKKDSLVGKIIEKQAGNHEAVEEKMAGIIGGLDA